MTEEKKCFRCGGGPSPSLCSDGFGYDQHDRPFCYACCAVNDKARMSETGKYCLYFDENKKEVTNWPGSLRFLVWHAHQGGHNWAGTRWDYWFDGPDGQVWHGYTVGQHTQIAHCQRTKRPAVERPIEWRQAVGLA